jgi:hypothetical protein
LAATVPAKAISQLATSSLEEDTRFAYAALRDKCDPRAYDLLAAIEQAHLDAVASILEMAKRIPDAS